MIIKLLMFLLLIAFVLPTLVLGCNSSKIVEKENSMVSNVTIPSIDVSAPTEIETATFSLG